MAESGRGIGLAVLLGGFFAVASGGGVALSTRVSAGAPQESPPKKRTPVADKTAETPKPQPSKDVYSFLERFAGTAGAPAPGQANQESSNDGQARTTRALRRLADLGYPKVKTLLATVPDPEDSRFANVFDDVISAIRMALERSGFVDDRFSDPWRAGAGAGGGEGARPSRRDQPGALLFRRPSDGTLLVVLLVGETPARGVHRRAFEAALDLSAAVLAAQPQPAATPLLPLLGPTLSGTSESIRMTLLRWFEQRRDGLRGAPEGETEPPFSLEIISGSATSDDNQKTLRDDLTRQVRALYPSATRGFTSTFQATVHPSSVQERFVVDYLVERGRCRIGLLTESSTGYGTQFADLAGRKAKRVCRDATPVRLIDLPFPLHISKLRSEYDRSQSDGADEKPSAAQKRFRPLEREDDNDIDEDAFPAKSRVTQSVSEIALEQTLRAIATEDVHAIVIVASSTADVLFLVQKVRQSFPNVSIVLTDAALMYLHEDVPFMEGVLVASTYPLLPWAQRLTFPFEGDQIRLLFASTAAQGAYNALLMLLDDLTQVNVLDYGGPFTVPTGDFRPWLWMTVVSRGEFWPVWSARGAPQSYLQIAEPRGNALEKTDEIEATIWTVPGSYVFRVAAFLIVFVDLLLAYAYARGLLTRHRHRKRPVGPLTGLFVPPRDGFQHLRMYRFEITGLLFIAFLVSAGFLAVEVVTVLPMRASVGRFEVPLTVAFGAVTAGMLALTFHALFRWVGSLTTRARARERVAVPFAILSAMAASLLIYLLCASRIEVLRSGGTAGAGVAQLMFFIERARNLDGGVSLLWTVLLLGVAHAVWILGHIRQVRITEDADDLRRYGVIPAHHDAGMTTTTEPTADRSWLESLDLARPMLAVVREVEGVWPTKFAMLLMLIVLIDAMWISSGLACLEPRRWGLACASAYGLLLALSVYGCTRYLRAWRALAEVLAKVAPRSVTSALGRIPAELLTSFRRPWDRQVFEVWQHHCRAVFDRIRNEPGLLPRSSAALGVSKEDLLDLLKAPVPVQLEEAERLAVPATAPSAVPSILGGDQSGPLWEEFLAMRLVAFIQYVRTHLSNLVAVSTAALLPAFWATNFYPLKEDRFLLMLVLVVATATTSLAALVFVQMNRNYVLSKMSHTSPGRVTWDRPFTTRLLIHVALPLLAVLAVKFPELGRAWTTVISALALSR